MSTEKKILFLFLSLITLIITCVFTHVGDFVKDDKTNTKVNEQINNEPDALKTLINKIKSFRLTEDEESSKIKSIKNTLINIDEESKKELNKSSTLDDNLEKKEEIETVKEKEVEVEQKELSDDISNNKIEEELEKQSIESELVQEEEIVKEEEKILPPLITLDKRYRRTGNEKLIQNLSRESQEIQLRFNDYIKQNPIIFRRASDKITKKSNKSIQTVALILEEYPNIKIEVAGHTDAAGAAKLNQRISEMRALSVKNKLISLGISKERIKARGYGEGIPLVQNSSKGYSQINRRVEFNIIEE